MRYLPPAFVRLRTVIVLGLLLAGAGLASVFDVYRVTRDTCLDCRAIRARREVCGLRWQSVEHSPASTALLKRAPSHAHRWRWSGSINSYSLFLATYACGRQHPIWSLQIEAQAEYARVVSADELQDTLQAIDSGDRSVAREAIARISDAYLQSLVRD